MERIVLLSMLVLFSNVNILEGKIFVPDVCVAPDSTVVDSFPELIVKDSSFFYAMDYIMYNSICPTIRTMDFNYMFISCNKQDSRTNSYTVSVDLTKRLSFIINGRKFVRGCFKHRELLVFWKDDIPENVFDFSDDVKYTKVDYSDCHIPEGHQTSFEFSYENENLELTGIFCSCGD